MIFVPPTSRTCAEERAASRSSRIASLPTDNGSSKKEGFIENNSFAAESIRFSRRSGIDSRAEDKTIGLAEKTVGLQEKTVGIAEKTLGLQEKTLANQEKMTGLQEKTVQKLEDFHKDTIERFDTVDKKIWNDPAKPREDS
jgi:hypothetical protein